MSKMKREEFEQMPFFTHRFLAGIPYSLQSVELKGGRKGMKIAEIYEIIGFNKIEEMKLGIATKFLFWLRVLIGRIFGWDDDKELFDSNSYISRLTEDERSKSQIEPGKVQGDTHILYCYYNEVLGEIINRTVHCFWLTASREMANEYDLILAVYVRKLNWRTPIYMALVTPVLNWVIYPSIRKDIKRRWAKEFPAEKVLVEKEFV